MKEHLKMIHESKLFKNISDEGILTFLSCAKAKVKTFKKDEIIYLSGTPVKKIGLILEGSCHIIREDFWGNKTIIGEISESEIFGEVFALQDIPLENTVITKNNAKILFIDISNILHMCSKSCSFHAEIINNLVQLLAKKTIKMNRKLEHITKRTMKDKILSYLSSVSRQKKSKSFEIPFNRTELSEFLCVDRTALSKELSKLQKEGTITYKKNFFTLN